MAWTSTQPSVITPKYPTQTFLPINTFRKDGEREEQLYEVIQHKATPSHPIGIRHEWHPKPIDTKGTAPKDGFSPNLNKQLHCGHLKNLMRARETVVRDATKPDYGDQDYMVRGSAVAFKIGKGLNHDISTWHPALSWD